VWLTPVFVIDVRVVLQIADMSRPFDKPLLVDLAVDARYANTWYDAK
jgi:hypothetical protein